ncbi:hypothetical protein E3U55_16920 [Filobacillus milosensis]|uniref:Uncharacterized protein n=1 Tax=Filobacillus milosensis TaxID=94137 RepID=A0A4Y8ID15_9BACI|nr:hypothetical protein [Filobacillus milosensis]TFB12913.1 hypothetical protein E3U55_16920 [Filobacillus milosensis]
MPIIKEFDLDLPYVKKGGNREDYEKNWKEKRMQFRDEIRCVTSLFEQNFQKYKSSDSWKVMVNCRTIAENNEVKCVGGVTEVSVDFDIDNYFSLINIEKKKLILSTLKNGIDIIVDNNGWDPSLFDEAYQKVIDCNYENHWVWQKPKKSPDRKHNAQVYCEHDIDKFTAHFIIKDNTGEVIKAEKIIEECPNEWYFHSYFGQLKWITSKEVALINKDGTNHLNVQI